MKLELYLGLNLLAPLYLHSGMSIPHKPRLVGRVPANRALTTRQTSASKLNDSFKYREAATYLMELPPSSHAQGARSTGLPPNGDAGSGAANGQRVVNMGGLSADDDKGTKDSSNQRDVFYVVGLPLSTWTTSFQFFFLMGSIFFFFLIYGYCQVNKSYKCACTIGLLTLELLFIIQRSAPLHQWLISLSMLVRRETKHIPVPSFGVYSCIEGTFFTQF